VATFVETDQLQALIAEVSFGAVENKAREKEGGRKERGGQKKGRREGHF
jgi:hypothetical protein